MAKFRLLSPPPIAYAIFEYRQASREMNQPGQLGLELVVLEKGEKYENSEKYKNWPVLYYPEKTTFKPFHKILCLKTGHSVDIKIISKIIRLFGMFDPEITILHILDEFNGAHKIMCTELRQKYISATNYYKIAVRITRLPPIRDIEEQLDWKLTVKRFNLLVIQKGNKEETINVLSGRTAGKGTSYSDIPVLIFRGL